jgi:hypothetical protein
MEADRRNVPARDRACQSLFERKPADRFDRGGGESRERDPPLLLVEPRGGPGAHRERQQGSRTARREGRGQVIERLARGRDPVGPRADPAADRFRRVLGGRFSLDRDERLAPVVLRQARESRVGLELSERRPGGGERLEDAAADGARKVECETPATAR